MALTVAYEGLGVIANADLIFYDTDGETPIRTFDLKDKNGEPADTGVYERVPA